jgi:DNA adenine methylase
MKHWLLILILFIVQTSSSDAVKTTHHPPSQEYCMNKLFAYPGGKWPIRHLVISAYPPHTTYVDVFGGSAALIISKEKSAGEVFNDKNEELANFFRVVKHRPAELAERAKHWLHSRALWNELKKAQRSPDEIERAFVFWVSLADSFGGMGKNFGTAKSGIRSVTHSREYLSAVAERFAGVHVECLDFRGCIRVYDSPETFFYIDPPYPDTRGGSSNYDLLTEQDWIDLRDQLKSIKGKFLLSSNDHKLVKKLFAEFNIRKINVRVTLPKNNSNAMRKELLISNYTLPPLCTKEKLSKSA